MGRRSDWRLSSQLASPLECGDCSAPVQKPSRRHPPRTASPALVLLAVACPLVPTEIGSKGIATAPVRCELRRLGAAHREGGGS